MYVDRYSNIIFSWSSGKAVAIDKTSKNSKTNFQNSLQKFAFAVLKYGRTASEAFVCLFYLIKKYFNRVKQVFMYFLVSIKLFWETSRLFFVKQSAAFLNNLHFNGFGTRKCYKLNNMKALSLIYEWMCADGFSLNRYGQVCKASTNVFLFEVFRSRYTINKLSL